MKKPEHYESDWEWGWEDARKDRENGNPIRKHFKGFSDEYAEAYVKGCYEFRLSEEQALLKCRSI